MEKSDQRHKHKECIKVIKEAQKMYQAVGLGFEEKWMILNTSALKRMGSNLYLERDLFFGEKRFGVERGAEDSFV